LVNGRKKKSYLYNKIYYISFPGSYKIIGIKKPAV